MARVIFEDDDGQKHVFQGDMMTVCLTTTSEDEESIENIISIVGAVTPGRLMSATVAITQELAQHTGRAVLEKCNGDVERANQVMEKFYEIAKKGTKGKKGGGLSVVK